MADLKSPPGSLALDCMLYFAKHHSFYTRLIGKSPHQWPSRMPAVERHLDSSTTSGMVEHLDGPLAMNACNCEPLPLVRAVLVVLDSLVGMLGMDVPGGTRRQREAQHCMSLYSVELA